MVKERHIVKGKVPQHFPLHLLPVFMKDFFRRVILERDNDATTTSLQDAVIRACVGVEAIHMAKVMREVKRQCRALRISTEQNTSVRLSDDSPSLSWLPRFDAQVMNKMSSAKTEKRVK